MNNIKAYAIANDGNKKRIAITYDVVDDETGKVIRANVKVNRIVTDDDVLEAIDVIDNYAEKIIE